MIERREPRKPGPILVTKTGPAMNDDWTQPHVIAVEHIAEVEHYAHIGKCKARAVIIKRNGSVTHVTQRVEEVYQMMRGQYDA